MRGRGSGFTLVEMMITVGIISILLAIAVPMVVEMQLKAKVAEVQTNMFGIADALFAYHAAMDGYPQVTASEPGGVAGKSPRVWSAGSGFDVLGWEPDGDVRATYHLMWHPGAFGCQSPPGPILVNCLAMNWGCIGAHSNIDGDTQRMCAWMDKHTNADVSFNSAFEY